jgi:hypothetical protein
MASLEGSLSTIGATSPGAIPGIMADDCRAPSLGIAWFLAVAAAGVLLFGAGVFVFFGVKDHGSNIGWLTEWRFNGHRVLICWTGIVGGVSHAARQGRSSTREDHACGRGTCSTARLRR